MSAFAPEINTAISGLCECLRQCLVAEENEMKHGLQIWTAALLTLLFSIPSVPQKTVQAEPFDGFPELVDALMTKWKVPGMAIAVVRDELKH